MPKRTDIHKILVIGPEPITSTFLISGFFGISHLPPSFSENGQTDSWNPGDQGRPQDGTVR